MFCGCGRVSPVRRQFGPARADSRGVGGHGQGAGAGLVRACGSLPKLAAGAREMRRSGLLGAQRRFASMRQAQLAPQAGLLVRRPGLLRPPTRGVRVTDLTPDRRGLRQHVCRHLADSSVLTGRRLSRPSSRERRRSSSSVSTPRGPDPEGQVGDLTPDRATTPRGQVTDLTPDRPTAPVVASVGSRAVRCRPRGSRPRGVRSMTSPRPRNDPEGPGH